MYILWSEDVFLRQAPRAKLKEKIAIMKFRPKVHFHDR